MSNWPAVVFHEECMREGMQIEDANISVDDKVALLNALSETGLKHIAVGSFVSPKWTPQMASIEEIVSKFTPKPDVTYTALIMNQRGLERALEYSPPLTIQAGSYPRLSCHICDVFARRNTNRTQQQEIESWPSIMARARENNVKEAGIGLAEAWGSNFLGEFSIDIQMRMLEAQHRRWDEIGIKVVSCSLIDTMSFTTPYRVGETISRIKEQWPDITHFDLHLHNGRNMALASTYEAMRILGSEDTVELMGSIGGIGGCPYCGNGRASCTAPTEDLLHMLDGMGIETGVDMDKLIECVWLAEEIIGRPLFGHVSKIGPRPKSLDQYYDLNMPFVETMEQVKHFKNGPDAYKGGIYPYKEPIVSPYRERLEQGLPAYDDPVDGEFPWKTYPMLK